MYQTLNLVVAWFFLVVVPSTASLAQELESMQFFEPASGGHFYLGGQGWSQEQLAKPYDRLPSEAAHLVRPEVWTLSRNSAGIYILFVTNSPTIKVQYRVGGDLHMPHMPATGVSGVDLYRSADDSTFVWCKGRYEFGDTVTYEFTKLTSSDSDGHEVRSYRLYLPLYNSVEYLKIGITESSELFPIQPNVDRPIVVYGTSIAQGACASRPGMAWTALLQRKIDEDIINLGFSGNAHLDAEMVSYIGSIDAKLYILDCLPNLVGKTRFSNEEISRLYTEAIVRLSTIRPEVPMLLVQHAGYTEELYDVSTQEEVERVNSVLLAVWNRFVADGARNLFFLSKAEIAMCDYCTVDGTHQTDLGMVYYANAYASKCQSILDSK